MTQLSGAHAFRRFPRQLSTDCHEILYRTLPSQASLKNILVSDFIAASDFAVGEKVMREGFFFFACQTKK